MQFQLARPESLRSSPSKLSAMFRLGTSEWKTWDNHAMRRPSAAEARIRRDSLFLRCLIDEFHAARRALRHHRRPSPKPARGSAIAPPPLPKVSARCCMVTNGGGKLDNLPTPLPPPPPATYLQPQLRVTVPRKSTPSIAGRLSPGQEVCARARNRPVCVEVFCASKLGNHANTHPYRVGTSALARG
jgi:hypothetical protein